MIVWTDEGWLVFAILAILAVKFSGSFEQRGQPVLFVLSGPGLLRNDLQEHPFGAPEDGQGRRHANPPLNQKPVQIIYAGDRVASIPHDDIALQQPRTLGRAVLLDRDDQDAALDWKPLDPDEAPWEGNILPADTDVAAADPAIADELASNKLCSVDGGHLDSRATVRSSLLGC